METTALKSIEVSVTNCARCGRDHDIVHFERFTRPIEIDDEVFKYFGMCPEYDEPILMRVVEDEKGTTIDVDHRKSKAETKES